MRSTGRRRTATLLGLTVLTVGGALVSTQQPAYDGRSLVDLRSLDMDDDGLRDEDELGGWRTQRAVTYVTDPGDADSDDDGLSDGVEAGLLSMNPTLGGVTYTGRSDPTSWDSDGDLLDDATEADARLDAWSVDTDGDGLEDFEEIEFGSDPLLADADGDHRNDAVERAEGSDPFTYDLDLKDSVYAFARGMTTDWRLSDELRDSWAFLLGSLARDLVGYGDAIRIVKAAASFNLRDLVKALGMSLPGLGDAARAIEAMYEFASRSPAASRAAIFIVTSSGIFSDEDRASLIRAVLSVAPESGRLSQDLAVHGLRHLRLCSQPEA